MRDFPVDDEDGAIARRREQLALLDDDGGDDEGSGVGADVYPTGLDRPTLKEEVFEEFVDAGDDELDRAGATLAQAGPHIDGLERKKLLRDAKWRDFKKEAPWTRITPPSVLRGTIGGQQEVFSDPLLVKTMQVALWQGEDAEATVISVILGPVQQLPAVALSALAPSDTLAPFGILRFGVRGMMVEAEIDMGRGVEFCVPASTASLQVALEPSSVNGSMKLSGMLSFLPVSKNTPVTRTRRITSLGGGANTFVSVPPFARSVTLWRNPTANGATLRFLNDQGAVIYTFALAGGAVMFDPVPLSPDIVAVDVLDGGGGLTSARLIFNLGF